MGNDQFQHIHRQRVQHRHSAVVTMDQLPHHYPELGWEQMVFLTGPVRQL
jgi:hypothetical protein